MYEELMKIYANIYRTSIEHLPLGLESSCDVQLGFSDIQFHMIFDVCWASIAGLGGNRETKSCMTLFSLLGLCVSSLRRGHANLLCIAPILTESMILSPWWRRWILSPTKACSRKAIWNFENQWKAMKIWEMYEHVRRTCEDLCEHLSNISRTSTVRARILRQCAAGNLGYTTSSDFRCWLGLDRGPRRESRNKILHDLVLTSRFVRVRPFDIIAII